MFEPRNAYMTIVAFLGRILRSRYDPMTIFNLGISRDPSAATYIEQTLRSQEYFQHLSNDAIVALSRICRTRTFGRGSFLFYRGDPSVDLILISKGRVRLSIVSAEGSELVLRYAGENTMLGEVGTLSGSERTADANAFTDVEAVAMPKHCLQQLFVDFPEIAVAFIQCLCDRIRSTTDQLEALALFSLETRLARLLLKLALETGPDDAPLIRLKLPYTQSEVADMISASRQQVNRAFKNLEEVRAIRKKPNEILCDIDRLSERASVRSG